MDEVTNKKKKKKKTTCGHESGLLHYIIQYKWSKGAGGGQIPRTTFGGLQLLLSWQEVASHGKYWVQQLQDLSPMSLTLISHVRPAGDPKYFVKAATYFVGGGSLLDGMAWEVEL